MVSLYDRSDFGGNLDALRAHLFDNIKGNMRRLPPTEDVIHLHLRRALHQLAIWKRAQIFQPMYPVATDFGRQLVNGKLVAIMMLKEAKSAEFKHNKYCRCKKGMCARGCSCGATENAGVENAIRAKLQGWKVQEWKIREQIARVENAGVEITAPDRKGGKCRSKPYG